MALYNVKSLSNICFEEICKYSLEYLLDKDEINHTAFTDDNDANTADAVKTSHGDPVSSFTESAEGSVSQTKNPVLESTDFLK